MTITTGRSPRSQRTRSKNLLWQGPPHQLLLRAFDGAVDLAVSPALLAELEGILPCRKFAARIPIVTVTDALGRLPQR